MFTYDPTNLITEFNRIRFELGDTNEYDQLLQDEEISFIQSNYTTFSARMAACCRSICAKVSRDVDHKAGGSSEKSSEIFKRYKSMLDRYESAAQSMWIGSISISGKQSEEEDTDRVKPNFKHGIHDNKE